MPLYTKCIRRHFYMSQNIEMIKTFLNLQDKDIQDVQITNNNGVIVNVILKSKATYCDVCGSTHILSNGYYSRVVKTTNDLFDNTTIRLKVKRFKCMDCHHSFSDSKVLAPRNSTVTYQTIIKIMELLKSHTMTFKEVAQLCNLSVTSVVRIFDKHCHINRSTLPEALCIDEVYTKNSDFKSKFSCILYDFEKQTIIDVLPSRRKNYLHHYFQSIKKDELDNVKYVCIDMYDTYRSISKCYFKKAIICADSFHVVKHINDDLNKTRIRVMNSYTTDSLEYYLLKNFNFLLLDRSVELENKAKFNKRLNRYINYSQILDLILSINNDLRYGYYIKERYFAFNNMSYNDDLDKQLDDIISNLILFNIPEFQEFTTLLSNWRQEILNSFSIYKGRRINNSIAESVNSRISSIIFNSKGIRNHERRRKRIMYAINKNGFLLK